MMEVKYRFLRGYQGDGPLEIFTGQTGSPTNYEINFTLKGSVGQAQASNREVRGGAFINCRTVVRKAETAAAWRD
jgi:hypothetical protein